MVIKHRLSVDAVNKDGSSPAVTRVRARELNYPPSVRTRKRKGNPETAFVTPAPLRLPILPGMRPIRALGVFVLQARWPRLASCIRNRRNGRSPRERRMPDYQELLSSLCLSLRPLQVLIGQATTIAAWPHATSSAPLTGALPVNLELTTWQLLEDGSALLRLTHIFPVGEHPTLSGPATVDLCAVFGAGLCRRLVAAGPASFTEMTAAGDAPIAEVERLTWRVKGEPSSPPMVPPQVPRPGSSMELTIGPADTRTFRLALRSDYRGEAQEIKVL